MSFEMQATVKRRVRDRIGLSALVVILAIMIMPVVSAEVTPADLDRARQEIKAVSADLEQAAIAYESALQQQLLLESELAQLDISIAKTRDELEIARIEGRRIAQAAYMAGGVTTLHGILDAEDLTEAQAQVAYYSAVSEADRQALNELGVLERTYDEQLTKSEQALEEQQRVAAELDALAADIYERLQSADTEYQQLLAEWEAQEAERIRQEQEALAAAQAEAQAQAEAEAAAAATSTTTTTVPTSTTVAGDTTTTSAGETTTTGGSTTTTIGDNTTTTVAETTTTTAPVSTGGGMVCPVNGPAAYTDTWGAPRSGGRSHKGVDMMAPRGTPLVAITDGVVTRLRTSSLGGITVYMNSHAGDEYYYAHMDGWAPGLSAGQAVAAGDLLGWVGSTGNASSSSPHLHFEVHPGGGAPVNPYPIVKPLCG